MPNVKNQPSIFYGCTELSYDRRNDEDSDPNTHAWISSDGSYFADRFYRQIVLSKKDGNGRQAIAPLSEDISQYSAVYVDPADPRNVRLLANDIEIRNSGLAACQQFIAARPLPVKNTELSQSIDISLPVTPEGKWLELRGDKYWMEETKDKWVEVYKDPKGPYLIGMTNSNVPYTVEGYSLKFGNGMCELKFQIKGKQYSTTPFNVAETDKDESVGFTLYFNGDIPLIAVGDYKDRPTEQTKQNVFPDEAAHVAQHQAVNTTSIDGKIAVISELMKKIRELVSPSEAQAFYGKIVMLSYDEQVEEARRFIAKSEAGKRKVETARVTQEPAVNTTSIDGKIAVISELMKKIRGLVSSSEAQAFYRKIVVLSYDDQVEEARQFIARAKAGKRGVGAVDITADRKKAETARVAQEPAAAKKAGNVEGAKRLIQVAAPIYRPAPVIAAKAENRPIIDTEKKEDKDAVKDYFAALQRLNILLEPFFELGKARGIKDWAKVNEAYLSLGVAKGKVAGNAPMVEKSYAVAEVQVMVVLFSEGQSEDSEAYLDQMIGTVSAKLEKGRDDLLIKKMDALKEFKGAISAKINVETTRLAAEEAKKKTEADEAAKKVEDARKAAEDVEKAKVAEEAEKAQEAAAMQAAEREAALEAEANRLAALKDAAKAEEEKTAALRAAEEAAAKAAEEAVARPVVQPDTAAPTVPHVKDYNDFNIQLNRLVDSYLGLDSTSPSTSETPGFINEVFQKLAAVKVKIDQSNREINDLHEIAKLEVDAIRCLEDASPQPKLLKKLVERARGLWQRLYDKEGPQADITRVSYLANRLEARSDPTSAAAQGLRTMEDENVRQKEWVRNTFKGLEGIEHIKSLLSFDGTNINGSAVYDDVAGKWIFIITVKTPQGHYDLSIFDELREKFNDRLIHNVRADGVKMPPELKHKELKNNREGFQVVDLRLTDYFKFIPRYEVIIRAPQIPTDVQAINAGITGILDNRSITSGGGVSVRWEKDYTAKKPGQWDQLFKLLKRYSRKADDVKNVKLAHDTSVGNRAIEIEKARHKEIITVKATKDNVAYWIETYLDLIRQGNFQEGSKILIASSSNDPSEGTAARDAVAIYEGLKIKKGVQTAPQVIPLEHATGEPAGTIAIIITSKGTAVSIIR